MEQIISFLEKYWGYSLIGGITFGTIVTFIVIQIKTFLRDKLKNTQIGRLLESIDVLKSENEDLQLTTAALVTRNEHLEQVQAATFKTLSYLSMASKLTTEDKLELQADYAKLAQSSKASMLQLTTNVAAKTKEAVSPIVKEGAQAAVSIVGEAAAKAVSLLERYVDPKTGDV